MTARVCRRCAVEFTVDGREVMCSQACRVARRNEIAQASRLKKQAVSREERVKALLENTLQGEEWKEIPDTFSGYLISSFGRVKSMSSHGRILKPYVTPAGYAVVGLSVRGSMRTLKMHRLIAQAFLPNPENLPVVDHIDRNPANNYISNLRWASHAENRQNSSDVKLAKVCIPSYIPGRGYRGDLMRNGVRYVSPYYKTSAEAIAYKQELLAQWGESETNLEPINDEDVYELLAAFNI